MFIRLFDTYYTGLICMRSFADLYSITNKFVWQHEHKAT